MEVISGMTGDFLFRFLHIFFGIIWIGTLYYFNFMQTPFFGETDASTKNNAISKLVPRALWWFRWGAMFTFVFGLILLWYKYGAGITQGGFMMGSGGMTITIGMTLGILMFLNVWLIIWPKQKIVIASTQAVLGGGAANPAAAAAGARASVASRTNTLFSIPMLFFMVASGHYPIRGNPDSSTLWPFFGTVMLIIALIELNAIKGKLVGPLKTIPGVIHAGLGLIVIFFGLLAVVSTF
jgi:uncharacterized membrane protein